MRDIKEEMSLKIKDYLEGRIDKNELYKWGIDLIIEHDEKDIKDGTKEIIEQIFFDLIELNEPEWSTWSDEKAQYYYDCLVGKKEYSLDKAGSLGRQNKRS